MSETDLQHVDILITRASQLVTMSNAKGAPFLRENLSDIGTIENGAIGTSNGKIVAVGSLESVRGQVEVDDDTKIIDAGGKLVVPGFVDPHTHLIFGGSREMELDLKLNGHTYLDILKMGGGILSTVRSTRAASQEELVKLGSIRLDTMLRYGTTTVEAKSGYGLTYDDELKSLRAIRELQSEHIVDLVPTFLGAHAVPEEFKESPRDYVRIVVDEMIPAVGKEGLAKYCDVFCERGVFTVDQSREILLAGKQNGLEPVVHADEIVRLGGAELAAEVGATSASHLLQASSEGLEAMAEAKVAAQLLPGTIFSLMQSEYPNALAMVEMGVPVALSTDFNPNCWTESMQFVQALSCYCMGLRPAEALAASTINAAWSIGVADKVGSLEVGKQADILVLNVPNVNSIPYRFGTNHVETVIKNGQVVVKGGALLPR